MGNEPDLYSYSSNRRTGTWNISTYESQLTTAMDNMAAWDASLPMDNFMLPSVCWCVRPAPTASSPRDANLTQVCFPSFVRGSSWSADDMMNTGLLDIYSGRMNALCASPSRAPRSARTTGLTDARV